MDIDESSQLGRRIGRQVAAHGLQLAIDGIDGIDKSLRFGFDSLFGNQVMLDVTGSRTQQVCATYRDAA